MHGEGLSYRLRLFLPYPITRAQKKTTGGVDGGKVECGVVGGEKKKVVKVVVTQGFASTAGMIALNYEKLPYSPGIRVLAVLRKTPAHEFGN